MKERKELKRIQAIYCADSKAVIIEVSFVGKQFIFFEGKKLTQTHPSDYCVATI